MDDGARNRWNPDDYDDDHGFVHEYGEGVVDLLDPNPGERVLDLGCGTGHLTAEIGSAVGPQGEVVGIDRAAEMVREARETYSDPSFQRADARSFSAREPFDAVFSNAALHWISDVDQNRVLAGVADALRPGGRFVVEMGGSGNVDRIVTATLDELDARGYDAIHPWYFPSVGEYAPRLETHGFEVRHARLFDRPTELDGGAEGLANWLGMFGDSLFSDVPDDERAAVVAAVEDRLRPDLFDGETWTADYRRLRFHAVRDSE
ncbi:class I SAM-dependent methyltransferase [Halorientalis pallida]|uniref:Methyltransferase domain-containing protein n=1 Tax=Halorientalis pallida TaxID=2479928 RepID=A0A498KXK6_9EURY|nr:class I SAM-dependent methyltransferase [Halorientalis pallida]RXK46423.1 methyltransferase domain-containing protein [Halorientalis pallida]